MAIDSRAARRLYDAVREAAPKQRQSTVCEAVATVKGGRMTVRLDGAEGSTPVASSVCEAKTGDTVLVRIAEGKCVVLGNVTTPGGSSPATGGGSLPVGSVTAYAGARAPKGWLLCDGSTVAAADYPELYAAIGRLYGGSGGGFSLPNLCGRVPVGAGGGYKLGAEGGEAEHVLTADEMPAHSHATGVRVNWYDSTGSGVVATYSSSTNLGVDRSSDCTGTAGSGAAHNNMQPYVALNYIIKAKND